MFSLSKESPGREDGINPEILFKIRRGSGTVNAIPPVSKEGGIAMRRSMILAVIIVFFGLITFHAEQLRAAAPGMEVTVPLEENISLYQDEDVDDTVLPVPEPSGVALMGAGMIALGLYLKHTAV